MSTYVTIFQYLVLIIDLIVVATSTFCVYKNGRPLLINVELVPDVRVSRSILTAWSLSFLLANYEATQRHLQKFLFDPAYFMDIETADSLMTDRGFMMFSGFCLLMFTLRHYPKWFGKIIT